MCGIICLIQYGGKQIKRRVALDCLNQLTSRGPDKKASCYLETEGGVEIFMGFTRLAIMDTSDAGQQPFEYKNNYVVCNGEIYNYKDIANKYSIPMKTSCDCEIILPLYKKIGLREMIQSELDAEFAMVISDSAKNMVYAVRDRYGVRPLYYGYNTKTKMIGFASELGALHGIMEFVEQVKPNMVLAVHTLMDVEDVSKAIIPMPYYNYNNLMCNQIKKDIPIIHEKIRKLLTSAVQKRLYADREIGFLLSGGLDSSLIVAIATKILGSENIVCFSIGLPGSPDVEAAKKVVEYLGIKQHHIIPFSIEDGLASLPEVIRIISTYDITTIRASTPQVAMAKVIKEKSNIRVLLSGEGSDEIHGSYRYFRDAPNSDEFHKETIRLLEELYMFDNLRTDRTMSNSGLEVRVPFLDFEYVQYIMSIDPTLLMYKSDYMEKQIIRDSFKGYLPDEILYRSKEAFSDAVSSSEVNWATSVQQVADKNITDYQLVNNKFVFNKPKTKDALYFRMIFDQIYPNRDSIIKHYWLPRFQKEEVLDPSARVLKSY